MEAQKKPISNSIPVVATFYSSDLAELFRRNLKKLSTASSDFYGLLYVKAKYSQLLVPKGNELVKALVDQTTN